MCVANQNPGYVQKDDGTRKMPDGTELKPGDPGYTLTVGGRTKQPSATEIPLGDGLAGTARASILSRRERIRQAVEGE